MRYGTDSLLQRATFGYQEVFRGAVVPKFAGASGPSPLIPTDVELDAALGVPALVGQTITNASGSTQKFYFRGYCGGAVQIRALLGFSAITGAPTARIFKTRSNHITEFPNDAGASAAVAFAAFAAGTDIGVTLPVEGQMAFLLELTLPNGASVTIQTAEYAAQ